MCGYLNLKEICLPKASETGNITLDHATIGWPSDEEHSGFTLQDVSLHIPRGSKSLICGPLASGKTLLASHRQSWANF